MPGQYEACLSGQLPVVGCRDILELLVLIYNLHAMLILFRRQLLISTIEMTVDCHDGWGGRMSVVGMGPRRRRQSRSHDYRNRGE